MLHRAAKRVLAPLPTVYEFSDLFNSSFFLTNRWWVQCTRVSIGPRVPYELLAEELKQNWAVGRRRDSCCAGAWSVREHRVLTVSQSDRDVWMVESATSLPIRQDSWTRA